MSLDAIIRQFLDLSFVATRGQSVGARDSRIPSLGLSDARADRTEQSRGSALRGPNQYTYAA